jgi:hypothetical protein
MSCMPGAERINAGRLRRRKCTLCRDQRYGTGEVQDATLPLEQGVLGFVIHRSICKYSENISDRVRSHRRLLSLVVVLPETVHIVRLAA